MVGVVVKLRYKTHVATDFTAMLAGPDIIRTPTSHHITVSDKGVCCCRDTGRPVTSTPTSIIDDYGGNDDDQTAEEDDKRDDEDRHRSIGYVLDTEYVSWIRRSTDVRLSCIVRKATS